MKKKLHIGEEIKKELHIQYRSIAWLAIKIDCDASNLHKKLKSRKMNHDLLTEISSILNKDFFKLYSMQLIED